MPTPLMGDSVVRVNGCSPRSGPPREPAAGAAHQIDILARTAFNFLGANRFFVRDDHRRHRHRSTNVPAWRSGPFSAGSRRSVSQSLHHVHADGVIKRQHLRECDDADSIFRIHPEVRVIDSRPGIASRASLVCSCTVCNADLKTQPELVLARSERECGGSAEVWRLASCGPRATQSGCSSSNAR